MAPKAGHVRLAGFPVRLALIVVVGIPLVVGLNPLVWTDPIDRTWAYLTHFLLQPKPELLYLGELLGAGRLPWHGPLVLFFATLPPVTAILATSGLILETSIRPILRTGLGHLLRKYVSSRPDPEAAGPEAYEAKRWSFAMLVTTLVAAWLVGGPTFGVVDLLALAIPFLAVFAGCTVSRLLSVAAVIVETLQQRHGPLRSFGQLVIVGPISLLGTLVFMGPLAETLRSHPVEEAYYSWLIGGTEGAVSKGLPRFPHGPIPPVVAHTVAERAAKGETFAVVPNSEATRRVLDRYRSNGIVEGLPPQVDVFDADIVVIVHDDIDVAYYELAGQFAASYSPRRSLVLWQGNVRIVTIGLPF